LTTSSHEAHASFCVNGASSARFVALRNDPARRTPDADAQIPMTLLR
jgi:hypothetical protein